MKFRVVGLSGLAGCGKDTFFKLLSEDFPTMKRFALADALKTEMQPFLLEKFGIDILKCSRQEKETVRPLLVAYGLVKRTQTKGHYWTKILQRQIRDYLEESPDNLACVTDVRYDKYPMDEAAWLKQNHGVLVHIKMFKYGPGGKPSFQLPPNKEEAENDPKVQKLAHYKLVWPYSVDMSGEVNTKMLKPYVDEFITFFRK